MINLQSMGRTAEHEGSETATIAALKELTAGDLARAGGKGANLGELVRAGFPVPAGFVVTTAAYDRFVAANRLGETIMRVLREELGRGAAIRAAFEQAPIPADLEHAIRAAYDGLGSPAVAVRSSATAEDLPGAAFAGQQETFLNVVDAEALLDAVRRCWASLWGDRAIAYRERLKLDQSTVKLAVVVQTMVAADFAGVMFTANPVTGAREEIEIDANPGLGEAVVSGLVTPDHFVLRRRALGWKIVGRQSGRREVMIRPRAEGGTERVEGLASPAPQLPSRALRDLARLGRAIQWHFGSPQDVEWALAGGQVLILQARPITALPVPLPHVNQVQRMAASNFGEMLPVRPYPLDMDTWIPALGSALEPVFGLLGLDWSFLRLFEQQDDVVVRFNPQLPRPTWRTLLTPLRLLPLIRRYDPVHWESDPRLAETQARVRDLEARDLQTLTWQELVETLHAAKEIPLLVAGQVRRRYFPGAAFSFARLYLLLTLLGRANQFGMLLSGVENKTLEGNHALEELADRVRSNPDLANTFSSHPPEELEPALEEQPAGRAFLIQFRAFLDRYGHRESMISTALQPTWKDAPEVVLGIVKSFAAQPPPPPAGKPAWEVARDDLLQHPLVRLAPLRSAFLELLPEARALTQIREDTHSYATLALPLIRRASLELGRRLVGAGILEAPEDVFHLKLDELERAGSMPPPPALAQELRAAVRRRKQARAELEGKPLVDPRLFAASAPEGDELLRGLPGSPGIAEGPACIVRDASEFAKLGVGDVLVAPYTNPSWTPLFQRAAAVVVDSGSAGSHAAIVAREYHIPGVMATVTGTQTLHDGEWVRVDGNRGTVQSAERHASGRER